MIIWCKLHLELQTNILFHENVVGFDSRTLAELLSHDYNIATINCTPADVMGFNVMNRSRVIHIMCLKKTTRILGDIRETYCTLSKAAVESGPTIQPEHLFWARDTDILLNEMEMTCNRHSEAYPLRDLRPFLHDWTPLLSASEQNCLQRHLAQFEAQHGMDASTCPSAVLNISQNAEKKKKNKTNKRKMKKENIKKHTTIKM